MFNNLKNIPYTDNDNDSNDNNVNSDASDDDIFFKRGSGIRFNVDGSKRKLSPICDNDSDIEINGGYISTSSCNDNEEDNDNDYDVTAPDLTDDHISNSSSNGFANITDNIMDDEEQMGNVIVSDKPWSMLKATQFHDQSIKSAQEWVSHIRNLFTTMDPHVLLRQKEIKTKYVRYEVYYQCSGNYVRNKISQK